MLRLWYESIKVDLLFMKTNNYSWLLPKFAAVVPLALLASCASTPRYVEPNLPPDQVAVLEITAPMWIVSLDGQSVASSTFSDRTRVRVAPGAHNVVVSYRGMQTHSAPAPQVNGAVYNAGEVSSSIHENADVTTFSLHDMNLNFVAKPGFTYDVDPNIAGHIWNPLIREVTPENNPVKR
jgi:hypothetical protein